ncbi:hypothetical protein [Vibrio salinus]|uniref:hypothetical protein n=1 Tax=Vibrio salinus TaxID=2899784 RepID=UPI001E4AAB03|nr:hypothetical protein [Vibrio salinus]MCE0495744.1 hypothetical protein [Vibrio salinus]
MLNKPVQDNIDTIPTLLIQNYQDYLTKGIFQMFHNREFCHSSIGDFFQYLCKTDGGAQLMTGLIKHLITMPINPNDPSQTVLYQQKQYLSDYLKKFVQENDDRFFAEFLEQLKEQPITISSLID